MPTLLSPERLAAITEWHRRLLESYEKNATDETVNAAGLGGIGVLLDDMSDLLNAYDAQREQFRKVLQHLMAESKPYPKQPLTPDGLAPEDPEMYFRVVGMNDHASRTRNRIADAAKLLNIDLNETA